MSDATSMAQLAMKKSPRGAEGGPSLDQGTTQAQQAYQVAVRKRIQEIGIKEKEFYYIAERSLKKGESWAQLKMQVYACIPYIPCINLHGSLPRMHFPQLKPY